MMFAEITTLVENLHNNSSAISRDLEAHMRDIFQAIGVHIRAPPNVVWTPKLVPSLTLLLSDPLAGMPPAVDVAVVARLFPDAAAAPPWARGPAAAGAAALLAPGGERTVPLARLLMFVLLMCPATTEAKLRLGFWLLDRHLRSEVDSDTFVEAMGDACLAVRAATCQQLLQQGQTHEVEKVQAPANSAFILALAQGVAAAAVRHVGTDKLDFNGFKHVLKHVSKSISTILMASLNYKVQVHHASQGLGSFSPSRSLDGGPLSCDEDEASSQLRGILCSFVKRSRMVDRFLEDRASCAGARVRELPGAGARSSGALHGSGVLHASTLQGRSTSGAVGGGHSGQFDQSGSPSAGDRVRRASILSADPSSPSAADYMFEESMEDGQIISVKRRSIVLPKDSVAGPVTRRGGHLALSIPAPSSTTNEAASPRSGPASVASGMSQMSASSKERPWGNSVSRFFAMPRTKSKGTSLPIVRGTGVAMAQLQGQTIISKSCYGRENSRSPSPTRLTFDSVGINRNNTPPSAASQQERLAQYIGALPLVGGPAPPRTSSNDNSCAVTLSPPASAGASGPLPHHHAQVSMTTLPCPDFSPLPRPDGPCTSAHKSLSFTSIQSARVGSPASHSSAQSESDSQWASIIATPREGESPSPTSSAAHDVLWRITENNHDECATTDSLSKRGGPPCSGPVDGNNTPSGSAAEQQRHSVVNNPFLAGSPVTPALIGQAVRPVVYSTDTSMASPPSSAIDAVMGPTPRTPFEIEPLSAQGLVEARDHPPNAATPKTSDSSIRFPTPVSVDNKTTPEPFLPMKSVVPEGTFSEEDVHGGVKIRVTMDDSVSRDMTVDDKLSRRTVTRDEDLMADTDIDTLLQEYTQALEDLKATMLAEQAKPDDTAFFASTLKFAGTIGGKIFILGSMRLLLSITLVFFDAVIFLILFSVVHLNPVVSLASVVGINVLFALILLLLVLRSTKGPEGLSTVLAGQTNNPIIDSIPPQFRPMFDNVLKHVRIMGEESTAQKGVAEGTARPSDGGRPMEVRVSQAGQDEKQLPDKLLDIVSQWAEKLPDKHKDLKLVKVIQEAVHDLQTRQQKRRSTAEHPAAPYAQRNVRFFMEEPDEQVVPTDGMRINKPSPGRADINFAPTHASKRSATGGRMASVKRA